MSRSHVMVLPSVEEGLALVQARGCPVIGTYNTGAEYLFSDGQEGYRESAFPTPWTVPDARLWAEIKMG
jgi:hypothetical protein